MLAALPQRMSCKLSTSSGIEVNFANKIGCYGNIAWGIEKKQLQIINRQPKFYQSCVVEVEIIGLTQIIKNIF